MGGSRERIIDVGDGVRLWTVSEGAGRPVVLCHGGPGGIDNLGPVSAMIADRARVRRYEQRACGRSTGGPPFTMATAVRDLDALRGHWGYERWVVAGHSFGAALALAYALEHPGAVDGVVYVSCVVRLAGQPDWYEQYRRTRRDRMAEPEAKPSATNAEVNDELGRDFVRYFAEPEVARRLAALDVPVLLVHGSADPRPFAAVEALAGHLRRARLIRLDGVGHMPFLESPLLFRGVLREFLSSCDQPRPHVPAERSLGWAE